MLVVWKSIPHDACEVYGAFAWRSADVLTHKWLESVDASKKLMPIPWRHRVVCACEQGAEAHMREGAGCAAHGVVVGAAQIELEGHVEVVDDRLLEDHVATLANAGLQAPFVARAAAAHPPEPLGHARVVQIDLLQSRQRRACRR